MMKPSLMKIASTFWRFDLRSLPPQSAQEGALNGEAAGDGDPLTNYCWVSGCINLLLRVVFVQWCHAFELSLSCAEPWSEMKTDSEVS